MFIYFLLSFPTRERGLKYLSCEGGLLQHSVVPHAGTWIEISFRIELHCRKSSFPTRERGLKWLSVGLKVAVRVVTHMGMQIEITKRKSNGVVYGAFSMRNKIAKTGNHN